MYKIYFNEGALLIAQAPSEFRGINNLLFIGDDEIHKSFKILTSSESTGRALNFGLVSSDPAQTFADFTRDYRVIQAAGGLVFSKSGELLTIKRNGLWDLPKGKIEKHEDRQAAALREVMEETGLNMLNISDKVGETYHAYYEDEHLLLKETHWYLMQSSGKGILTPQIEEGITEAVWKPLSFFKDPNFRSYLSIKDIISTYLNREAVLSED